MAATLFLNNSKDLDVLLGYLHLPPKRIEISKKRCAGSFGNLGPAFQHGESLTSGILSASKALINFASDDAKSLIGTTELNKACTDQWIEYFQTHLKPVADDHQTMLNRAEELNGHLASQTFITGNHLSLADLFIFQSIHPFFRTLSFQDKEKYIHLSRWFDNMQNTGRIGHKLPIVHFHKTLLYS